MTIEQLPRNQFPTKGQPRELAFAWGTLPGKDIVDILRIVRRRLLVVVLTFLIGTALATFAVFNMTPLYTAKSAVLIEAEANPIADLQEMVSGQTSSAERIRTEVAVLQSRDFSQRVIEQLSLHEIVEFNPALNSETPLSERLFAALRDLLAGQEEARTPSIEEQFDRERVEIIDMYLDALKVEPVDGTLVIEISATSEDPALAARIANTVADNYVVEQLEAKFNATKRATDWLTRRLSDLRLDLEQAEANVEQFRSQAGLLQGGGNTTLAQQQIIDISNQLSTATARRRDVETRLAQAERLLRQGGGGAAIEVVQSPVVQGLRGQETELVRRVAQLSQQVGPNHPQMVAAQTELANIRGRIAAEIGRIIESLRSELNVARANEATLEKNLQQLEESIAVLNTKEGELRIREREAQASRQLYETFLGRFKQTEGQEQVQRSDSRIISRADVPIEPAAPNKPIIIAIAALGSLVLGLFLVALFEQFDRGIHSMEEVYRYLGLPCLGLVPEVTSFQLAGKRPESYVVWKPTSAFAEAIRSIRTSIMLSDKDVKPKVIAVTSSQVNEGKTTISMSMARINAMGGRRTLLVDLDLRKPEVHQRFQAQSDLGVIDYLSGLATLEDVIQRDVQTGLEFITAGNKTENYAELLRGGQIDQLVRDLGDDYDLIIFDAPPVLAVGDTRIIARAAEKTVFVTRWSETPRDVVKLGLRQLADAGADIAGIVISLVDVGRNSKFGFGDSEVFTGKFKKYYNS